MALVSAPHLVLSMFEIIQHDYLGSTGLLARQALVNVGARIVFSDPPYNIGIRYADDPTSDRLPIADYLRLSERAIYAMAELLAPGGTAWWMVPEEHADWVGPMMTEIIGPRIYRIVWHETFAQYQQGKLTEDYRFIFVHQKPGGVAIFNPDAIRIPSTRQELGDKRADPRGRVPGQVWKVRRLQGTSDDRVDWAPTQLPPEMCQRIVAGWSNEGDTVVDMFAGSGTMGVACKQLKRNFIGIDRSPTYCDKMRERLA